MNIAERDWEFGKTLYYENIEPEYTLFTPGVRVLPAKYFYEKSLYFTFTRLTLPGINPRLPKGGIDVRSEAGGWYTFELDQVIIHPYVIKHNKRINKIAKRAANISNKALSANNKTNTGAEGRGRGRPPLSPEIKAARLLQTTTTIINKEGEAKRKRGRPSSGKTKAYVSKGGKRGRPALSEEEKAKRFAALSAKEVVIATGKRGRPSNPAKRAERQRLLAERLAANPTKRRGRPPISGRR